MLARVSRGERQSCGTLRARACLVAACVLLLGLLFSPAALAASIEGGNSFTELTKKAQEEPAETTSTATSTTATGSEKEVSNSGKTIVIGIVAALFLLLAIAFVIVRDARRNAPVGDEELAEVRAGHDAAVRRRKQRAKAKAARRARKQNR
jgi:hypothetical protein